MQIRLFSHVGLRAALLTLFMRRNEIFPNPLRWKQISTTINPRPPSISIAKLKALRAPVDREVALVGGIGGGGVVDEGVLPARAVDEIDEARAGRAAICAGPFEIAAGLPAAAIPGNRDMIEFERRIATILPQQRFGIVNRLRPPIAAASRQRDASQPDSAQHR